VLTPKVRAKLEAFRAAGGVVVERWEPGTLASRLIPAIGQDFRVEQEPAQDLRVTRYHKGGRDFYFLVNEGAELIERRVSLAATGALELWDPMDGSARPWPARLVDGRLQTDLRLERRQGLVLAVNPQGQPDADARMPRLPGDVALTLSGPWCARDSEGKEVDVPCPGDWAHAPALGVRAWAPYVLPVGDTCRPGANTLEVHVTNSMANSIQGLQLPSGIQGPVCLRSSVLPEEAHTP